MASRSGQSSYDPYNLFNDDDKYLIPTNVAEMTPGWSAGAASWLTAARLYLNSSAELPLNWWEIYLNLNDYQSDPMEISSTFWLPDITNWWQQQGETHSKYADLSNVALDMFSIISHGIRVEASFSLGRDVTGWRQSNTSGEPLWDKMLYESLLEPIADYWLATTQYWVQTALIKKGRWRERRRRRSLHRMSKVYDFLEMWQGSQTLRGRRNKSGAHNKQLTAVGYISDTIEIVKASWSNIHHDGAAAFKLSEISPVPPAVSLKHLPGGQTQVLNVRRNKRIDRHAAESGQDSLPESNSDTENWLHWNGDLDNPNVSEDDWEADNESDTELDNGSEVAETLEVRNVSAAPNVPGLIQPIRQSKKTVEKTLVTVNIMEMRRNKWMKKK